MAVFERDLCPARRLVTLIPRSIVAIHGLATDPLTTWTWRSRIANNSGDDGADMETRPGINWLKDTLPEALPLATKCIWQKMVSSHPELIS